MNRKHLRQSLKRPNKSFSLAYKKPSLKKLGFLYARPLVSRVLFYLIIYLALRSRIRSSGFRSVNFGGPPALKAKIHSLQQTGFTLRPSHPGRL